MIRNKIALLGSLTIIAMSLAGCNAGGGNNAAGDGAGKQVEAGAAGQADAGAAGQVDAGAAENGAENQAAAGVEGQADDTAANPADAAEAGSSGQTAADAAVDVSGYSVMMDSGYQGDPNGDQREVAKIVCTDADGNVVWQKEVVSQHSATELTQVQEIGLSNGVYYYNWSGTVVALDVRNGEELWQNPDFTGASIHSAFTDDGRIVLCGYYGPAFFVCNTKGETLERIGEFENWYWPYKLEIEDGYAKIWFDNAEGEGLVKVNLDTYEYEMVR